MATRQIIPTKYIGGANNVVNYATPLDISWDSNNVLPKFPYASRLRQLGISLSSAPGSGKSWAFEVMKNGVSVTTITISDLNTTGSFTGNIAFAIDDTINLRRTPTSAPTLPTNTFVTWCFDAEAANQTSYMHRAQINAGVGYSGALVGAATADSGNSVNPIVPLAGVITKIKWNLLGPPTAGKSYLFTVTKNGVAQDGSGGTPDTRVTISDAAIFGEWAGTLNVAAGDYIRWTSVPTGSPDSGSTRVGIGVGIAPTVDGQSLLLTGRFENLSNTATTLYTHIGAIPGSGYSTTEADHTVPVLGSNLSFLLNALYLYAFTTLSNSPVWTIRKNSASPGGGLTVTIPPATNLVSDTTNSVSLVSGDTLSIQDVQSAGPGTAKRVTGAVRMFALAPGGGQGAGHGSKGNKGGGGVNIQTPGSPSLLNTNPGIDISTS